MPLLTEGSPAPAFSVPNQDGATVSLDQFAGQVARPVVVSESRHTGLNQGRPRVP